MWFSASPRAQYNCSYSRQLVRLMGDEIHVQSTIGQGSRFWFVLTLPRVLRPRPPGPRRCHRGVRGRRRILVVDDIAENRNLLVDLLHSKRTRQPNGAKALIAPPRCCPT
jgi:hypothetical protein